MNISTVSKVFRTLSLIILTLGTALSLSAVAGNLIMFDEDDCSWCRKWDDEIGVIYSITPESCQAPLLKVKLGENLPASVAIKESIPYTPTFVFIHEEEEVGRIVGYPGEEFFWSFLNEMIEENIPQDLRNLNTENCKNTG